MEQYHPASMLSSLRKGPGRPLHRGISTVPMSAQGQKPHLKKVRLCEGLRMPVHDDGATHTGAGVRKPPREETAGRWAMRRVRRYGDFGAGGLFADVH